MTFPDPILTLRILSDLIALDSADEPASGVGKQRQRIYSSLIVVTLMMYQRLNKGCSQGSAVAWLRLNRSLFWPLGSGCLKVKRDTISPGTGAYCQARQQVPMMVFNRLQDDLFLHFEKSLPPPKRTDARRVVIVDGTTLRLTHQPELVRAFPPGRNQHGQNHWPTLQVVAFHDADTGLATRPCWGPMYGPDAVSEQSLGLAALEHVPADAVVLGDSNFGVFFFAYGVHQSQRSGVYRLTQARAEKILGKKPNKRMHKAVCWTPSEHERRAHPELPANAQLMGWLIVCRHPQRPKEKLYLFTTLNDKPKRVLALYKRRWNIETDLRHLKQTANLQELTGKSKEIVEKELLAGVMTYNLVRAVMWLAASKAGLAPRQLSFSNTLAGIKALPPLDLSDPESNQRRIDILISGILKTRLPNRSSTRTYPREVWGRGGSFPSRQATLRKQEKS